VVLLLDRLALFGRQLDPQAAQHAEHEALLQIEELVELALDGIGGLVDAGACVDDARVDAQRLVAHVVRAGQQPADASSRAVTSGSVPRARVGDR
jgi:hypothetical protein